MKVKRTDNAPEFCISAGTFGTFSTDTGVLEVPDDLPAWALVPGDFEIVVETPAKTRRVFKATQDEPQAPETDAARDEDSD